MSISSICIIYSSNRRSLDHCRVVNRINYFFCFVGICANHERVAQKYQLHSISLLFWFGSRSSFSELNPLCDDWAILIFQLKPRNKCHRDTAPSVCRNEDDSASNAIYLEIWCPICLLQNVLFHICVYQSLTQKTSSL